MTTIKPAHNPTQFRLPEPPSREIDEVTAFDAIYDHGTNHYLAVHFGNPDTTLVTADRWIVPTPEFNKSRARRPDLMIAFGVSPEDYHASRGYIISEQGKPPDFVLEVASESTADTDTGAKRNDYVGLGIPEYWRFDQTGEYHGARLAGDRLVDGQYEPIEIVELSGGVLQGYSEILNLHLRWNDGELEWVDPATEMPIPSMETERQGRIQQEQRADEAEERVRELEQELRRLRGD